MRKGTASAENRGPLDKQGNDEVAQTVGMPEWDDGQSQIGLPQNAHCRANLPAVGGHLPMSDGLHVRFRHSPRTGTTPWNGLPEPTLHLSRFRTDLKPCRATPATPKIHGPSSNHPSGLSMPKQGFPCKERMAPLHARHAMRTAGSAMRYRNARPVTRTLTSLSWGWIANDATRNGLGARQPFDMMIRSYS